MSVKLVRLTRLGRPNNATTKPVRPTPTQPPLQTVPGPHWVVVLGTQRGTPPPLILSEHQWCCGGDIPSPFSCSRKKYIFSVRMEDPFPNRWTVPKHNLYSMYKLLWVLMSNKNICMFLVSIKGNLEQRHSHPHDNPMSRNFVALSSGKLKYILTFRFTLILTPCVCHWKTLSSLGFHFYISLPVTVS